MTDVISPELNVLIHPYRTSVTLLSLPFIILLTLSLPCARFGRKINETFCLENTSSLRHELL